MLSVGVMVQPVSAQYTDALNQYGPKFPKVVRLQEQIKDLDQIVSREKANIANQIEAEYRGSRQRELLLQQALDQGMIIQTAIGGPVLGIEIAIHQELGKRKEAEHHGVRLHLPSRLLRHGLGDAGHIGNKIDIVLVALGVK